MIIAVLIAGVVLLQKAKYLHEVYFHDIDSAPYFPGSKSVSMTS